MANNIEMLESQIRRILQVRISLFAFQCEYYGVIKPPISVLTEPSIQIK